VTVRSVEKALSILEAVAAERDGLTAQQISDRFGLPYATAHRMLTTLARLGYLHFQRSNKIYRIGPRVLRLYNPGVHQATLGRLVYPYMAKLSQDCGAAVHLAVRSGQEVVYLDTVLPPEAYARYTPVGTRAPLHSTALGKALIAFSPDDEIEEILENYEFRPFTPNTITSEAELRDAIEQIRTNGFSFDDEESTLGLHCVASVIVNAHGLPEAAISISSEKAPFTEADLQDHAARVCDVCRDASAALGMQLSADPRHWYTELLQRRRTA